MNKEIRTLLRAAYIAVLLTRGRRDLFDQGQLHVLDKHLHPKKWPVSTVGNDKLKDIVNHEFESHFVTTVKPYEKTKKRMKLCALMCVALGRPRHEAKEVEDWIFFELLDKVVQGVGKIGGNQQK